MILSDNETKLDLLNNQAIAKTIVSIIKDSKESVSIGVHGDWGAGKSSILVMVEELLNPSDQDEEIADWDEDEEKEWHNESEDEKGDLTEDIATVRFNSWQYQGFEDAKIALMSAIVTSLEKRAKAYYKKHQIKGGLKKLKSIAKNLWKNIDKLSLAKKAAKTGLAIATGTVPLFLLSDIIEKGKAIVTDGDKASSVIDSAAEALKKAMPADENSTYKEMQEFRKNFKDLFKEAHISKLVVIIDDLDRCLPEVAIDTLETIRLFMFMDETAFVIGADELMIRYAVKKHFPDVEREPGVNIGSNFADKYLEKLIQIPFRIPALGSVESQLYIMLLMIGSKLPAESDAYRKLISDALAKLSKPWDIEPYSVEKVKALLGKEYEEVQDEVLIALQISPILYDYSRGNPRVIKRFINMLLLRYAVADKRGYGKEIKLQILAKLMLAERSWSKLYENIARHLTGDGLSQELAALEKPSENDNSTIDLEWARAEEYKTWIESKPSLTGVDLRPYYTASKERIDYFGGYDPDEALREIISILMSDAFTLASHKDEIKALTEENATKAFEIITGNISSSDLSQEPVGFAGIKVLVELHPDLRTQLVDFVSALPYDKVDTWIITGWEAAIPTGSPERLKLEEYFDKLNENGNELVKQMMKTKRV